MCYAVIINKQEQLDKFKVLSNMSIFEILLYEFINCDKQFYIVANEQFADDIYSILNKHNHLINTDVHLLLLETQLDNYFITFILSNLIPNEIYLIPLDDFTFDKLHYPMLKYNMKLQKEIIWNHPVYIIKSSHFKSLFILNKQYKICPIEFFIDHKKTEFNYFFNKVHSWTSTMMPTMKIINKIQEYEYHKLTLYKFT